ncbi:metallophosphoesterase [Sinorhizobium numidicum]|uniref:Metallophosphoesterase n=1 Tax=Sinorhizobium numidicum TaxID=680248 RepID=A0ABY8CZU1_9HYPH|nr:metallophosphoesterase [Sinorhizobium numidicum]WEX77510.1 metallophosphoesterase [Sinorhizobium numidicum]WEX84170.1 metallophosphoesterase [Sinorhizobium numidicum]
MSKVKIAAVADLHVKEDRSVSYTELFSEISRVADVLVIAGDLTDLGKPAEAELLVSDLKSCTIPVVAVLGNHDHQCNAVEEISSILVKAGVHLLDGQTVEIAGVEFAGTKGFIGGFGRHMLGAFGEAAIKTMVSESVDEAMRLENALRTAKTPRALVVLHYAPIAETVAGEPKEIYPFLGSSRLAETIDRFEVSAVVHGHAHKGVYEGQTPGGAPVFNVATHVEKPTGRPYAILEL